MDGQRLVSLDTLLALGDGLNELAQGKPVADSLIPLAGELREFEMPRPMFTSSERSEWAAGFYNTRHSSLQTRTDLMKIIKSPNSHKDLADARGIVAPFLRDTLVGLNYAYYEPPGAQILLNNPLYVRSHDFSGEMAMGGGQSWHVPHVFGSGLPAGGGAHLAGSLADLPFVLAEAEQDFIVPENVQALIWHELVPGLVSSATLPRWWGVTQNELHAVTLYQRTGEELLAASARDEKLRATVLDILSERMVPLRSSAWKRLCGRERWTTRFPGSCPAKLFTWRQNSGGGFLEKTIPGARRARNWKVFPAVIRLKSAGSACRRISEFPIPRWRKATVANC